MKKILALFLVIALLCCTSGCFASRKEKEPVKNPVQEQETDPSTTPTTPSTTPTEPSTEPSKPETPTNPVVTEPETKPTNPTTVPTEPTTPTAPNQGNGEEAVEEEGDIFIPLI